MNIPEGGFAVVSPLETEKFDFVELVEHGEKIESFWKQPEVRLVHPTKSNDSPEYTDFPRYSSHPFFLSKRAAKVLMPIL